MENTNSENKVVNLYLEANPNPNSLKFVLDFMIVPEGKSYDFPTAASAAKAPLAAELFGLKQVERVFYMSNFVTVTKAADVEWIEIQDDIKNLIKNYLQAGKPVLAEDYEEEVAESTEDESDIEKKIKAILEDYIRPAVEQDGGAISFHSYVDGTVKVLLQGSCSGCPSSMITLKAGIENLLKRMVPEVQEVEAEGV
ncbi:NifU family protein [Fulvivirgaceae bacterium BMA12]|uniref:NifU family protein n=1 Tax=Agaribacillus aureus TaxID=3051825 RepID=A0ABT8LF71_9BACT|nr:NifU family protein [Fulvivirgaceae bacterium BMA12]